MGGSSPLGPTKQAVACNAEFRMHNAEWRKQKTLTNSVKVSLVTFLFKESNMLIENRIRIMKRTDSCILRKTCYIKY